MLWHKRGTSMWGHKPQAEHKKAIPNAFPPAPHEMMGESATDVTGLANGVPVQTTA